MPLPDVAEALGIAAHVLGEAVEAHPVVRPGLPRPTAQPPAGGSQGTGGSVYGGGGSGCAAATQVTARVPCRRVPSTRTGSLNACPCVVVWTSQRSSTPVVGTATRSQDAPEVGRSKVTPTFSQSMIGPVPSRNRVPRPPTGTRHRCQQATQPGRRRSAQGFQELDRRLITGVTGQCQRYGDRRHGDRHPATTASGTQRFLSRSVLAAGSSRLRLHGGCRSIPMPAH